MKKVKDILFIWHHVKKEFLQIEGEAIVIPGFEDHDIFVHKTVDGNGHAQAEMFTVSEGKSGYAIGYDRSKEWVVGKVTDRLKYHGREQLDRVIAEAVEKTGLSPRWSKEDELQSIATGEANEVQGRRSVP